MPEFNNEVEVQKDPDPKPSDSEVRELHVVKNLRRGETITDSNSVSFSDYRPRVRKSDEPDEPKAPTHNPKDSSVQVPALSLASNPQTEETTKTNTAPKPAGKVNGNSSREESGKQTSS